MLSISARVLVFVFEAVRRLESTCALIVLHVRRLQHGYRKVVLEFAPFSIRLVLVIDT